MPVRSEWLRRIKLRDGTSRLLSTRCRAVTISNVQRTDADTITVGAIDRWRTRAAYAEQASWRQASGLQATLRSRAATLPQAHTSKKNRR